MPKSWSFALSLTLATIFLWSTPAVRGAEPAGQWETFNADDDFTFRAPVGTRLVRQRGTDSHIGKIVGPGFDLNFDFGMYSNDLSGVRSLPGYVAQKVVINGHPGMFITALENNHYLVGVYVKDLSCAHMVVGLGCRGWISFDVHGSATDSKSVGTVRRLFETIAFAKRPFD